MEESLRGHDEEEMKRIHYGFMSQEDIPRLPPGHKKNRLTKQFVGVWTRFNNWPGHPPMVAVINKNKENERIIGFHAATFNKKVYINSYYLYVDEAYRGQGIAGELFLFSIIEAQRLGLTRFKNACQIDEAGDVFYQGFGLKPIARDKDHHYYDFSIEGINDINDMRKCCEVEVPEKAIALHLKKGREIIIRRK
jgi:GNAT superfamily N-acetyltransferase